MTHDQLAVTGLSTIVWTCRSLDTADSLAKIRQPPKPIARSTSRCVFPSDPTRVAERLEDLEDGHEVDRTRSWLVTTGDIRDLDVSNRTELTGYRPHHVLSHSLHVVHVVLQEQIDRRGLRANLDSLPRAMERESGNIRGIDAFDQQRDPGRLEALGSETEVADKRVAPRGIVDARWNDAGQAIHSSTPEHLGIFEGTRDAIAELWHPVRVTCDPTLSRRPVSRRKVEKDLREVMFIQGLAELDGVVVVRKHIFDATKAAGRGHFESIEEFDLSEHEGQVRSEIQHRHCSHSCIDMSRRSAGKFDAHQ